MKKHEGQLREGISDHGSSDEAEHVPAFWLDVPPPVPARSNPSTFKPSSSDLREYDMDGLILHRQVHGCVDLVVQDIMPRFFSVILVLID